MNYKEITLNEFEEAYKPIQDDDGIELQFDTYQEALDYVKENIIKEENIEDLHMKYRYIWTAIDSDDSYIFSNGYHMCNRLFYVVCKNPWGTNDDEENKNISIQTMMEY